MTYPVNPADPTTPVDGADVFQGAEEFRALKAYIQGLIPGGLGVGINFFRKNLVINGDHAINQRGATTIAASGYLADRFACNKGTGAATIAFNLISTNVFPGFTNNLQFNVTALTAPAAGDVNTIIYKVEGSDCQQLQWGTANAKTVTLSFWAQASLAGIYSGSLINSANNRSYVFSYNIAIANTPQFITIVIPGDVLGTWLVTNGIGVQINWDCGSGTTFQAPTTGWQAGQFVALTGATSLISGVNNLQIGGVQLEVGSYSSQFEYLPYAQKLALCQRYYENGTNVGFAGYVSVGVTQWAQVWYKVVKRVSPTITLTDLGGSANLPAPSTVGNNNTSYFTADRNASGTGQGVMTDSWTASAEL